ncbi:MAG: FAD-dependent oxidoreductase, partial [Pseudomonadota bacterium]
MSDFIVVGGGLIGLLMARELAEAGATVAVVERGEPGREASWAGGGILSPLYPWRYPDPVNVLARWSQAYFPELAAALADETGIDPEWTPSGLLMLDNGEYDVARAWAKQWGGRFERVDGAALAELEPALATPPGPALWWPELAQVRNPRLLQALVRGLALNKRVTLHAGLPVTGLLDEGDAVRGVHTAERVIRADAVVVAAGAWSAALLGPVAGGWDIAPVRGQMLLFKAPPDLVRHIVLADGHYLVPRRDGRILAGSTLEYVGFDKSTTPAAYRNLHAAALRLVARLADCPVERLWAGLRPGSPEGVP